MNLTKPERATTIRMIAMLQRRADSFLGDDNEEYLRCSDMSDKIVEWMEERTGYDEQTGGAT